MDGLAHLSAEEQAKAQWVTITLKGWKGHNQRAAVPLTQLDPGHILNIAKWLRSSARASPDRQDLRFLAYHFAEHWLNYHQRMISANNPPDSIPLHRSLEIAEQNIANDLQFLKEEELLSPTLLAKHFPDGHKLSSLDDFITPSTGE